MVKIHWRIFFILILEFNAIFLLAQVNLVSWNIRDLGRTKNEAEIQFMAELIRDYDIIAIQEIVAGYGGAQAVARMVDALQRMSGNWDYRISDPTDCSPHQRERYAFIWNRGKVELIGRPALARAYAHLITREPFIGRFRWKAIGKELVVINYHSIPYNKQPEKETKYLKYIVGEYEQQLVIIAGDFNQPQSHTVFNPIKVRGFRPVLIDQRTTINKKRYNADGSYLGHPIDNIFYDSSKIDLEAGGILDFVPCFNDLAAANAISDHLPVWGRFVW